MSTKPKFPPPAMEAREAPNPQPTAKKKRSSHCQEPAPLPGAGGGGGAGDGDRISGLPDAILGEVISLPTKDGARTQVPRPPVAPPLARRPLNLDSVGFPAEDDDAYAAAVFRVLSAHPCPGRRFRVAAHLIHRRPDAVDAWLRSPALDSLQEIDFCHSPLDPGVQEQPSPPPASISRFSGSLRVATFSKCHIPDGLVETLRFPELKQLGIEKVRISEGALHSLISSCPALECLFVNESYVFSCLRINSNSLKSIGVRAQRCYRHEPWLEELIIEDAPCLEKLLYADRFGIRLSVVAAPKLTTLGCPSDSSDSHRDPRILFGATEFQAPFEEP